MIKSRFIDQNATKTDSSVIDKLKLSITNTFEKIGRPLKLMHVCGTHESTVSRSGLRSLLPKGLRIISGPGCPVCVCPSHHISAAIELATEGCIITTFGDMLRVPDTKLKSLNDAKAENFDIRVVYSILDAIKIAKQNPQKKVIWLGVGFETTAPMAAKILRDTDLTNFYILTDFRLVIPAMEFIVNLPNHGIDGFILPGHVSVIIGSDAYQDFVDKSHIPCTIGGFSSIDFLVALNKLLHQIYYNQNSVENAYPSVVSPKGNLEALTVMNEVFKISDARWRGIGMIPNSGFILREKYDQFNAYNLINIDYDQENDLMKGCKCGEVILGMKQPNECRFFKKRCTPETPVGPCMVSDEGTCRIHVVYGNL